jgi:pimeloyl-ACP methyl ester carboxylesterase
MSLVPKRKVLRVALGLIAAAVGLAAALVVFAYAAPETATELVLRIGRLRAGLARKEIELPGGLRYVVLEGGQGEPLMLLHGFGATKDTFTQVARFLVPHYRVIVPDHIGFGESSKPAEADYAPPAQAERLRALAQALGLGKLHLGGNSMGGHIAMTYAALHPDEVGSLWLLDPSGVWSAPPSEMMRTIRATGRNPLVVRNEEEFTQLMALVMAQPPPIPGFMLKTFTRARVRNAALEDRIVLQLRADPLEARVKGLATPALIVWGERDRVLSVQSAEILHGLLPRSQVRIMAGIGHSPMLERPRQAAEDYLRFRGS